MNIEPTDLEKMGYVELDTLGHKDLVLFIRTYIRKRTKFAVLYYLSNLLVFGLTGYLFISGVGSADSDLGNRFTHFSYGLALAFTLVPLHEYIHVLAYKSQGAKKTSYAVNIKKFYFMALADRFVADRREFQVVALAPFVFITSALVVVLLVVDSKWALTIAGILLMHTAMCLGDFGLLSYFDFHKERDVVTYDDITSGTSYFFGRTRQERIIE